MAVVCLCENSIKAYYKQWQALQPFSINCPVFKNDSCALSEFLQLLSVLRDVDSSSVLSLERPSYTTEIRKYSIFLEEATI